MACLGSDLLHLPLRGNVGVEPARLVPEVEGGAHGPATVSGRPWSFDQEDQRERARRVWPGVDVDRGPSCRPSVSFWPSVATMSRFGAPPGMFGVAATHHIPVRAAHDQTCAPSSPSVTRRALIVVAMTVADDHVADGLGIEAQRPQAHRRSPAQRRRRSSVSMTMRPWLVLSAHDECDFGAHPVAGVEPVCGRAWSARRGRRGGRAVRARSPPGFLDGSRIRQKRRPGCCSTPSQWPAATS